MTQLTKNVIGSFLSPGSFQVHLIFAKNFHPEYISILPVKAICGTFQHLFLSEASQLPEAFNRRLHFIYNIVHLFNGIELRETESYGPFDLLRLKPHGIQHMGTFGSLMI